MDCLLEYFNNLVVNKVKDMFEIPGIILNVFMILINIKFDNLMFFSLLMFLLAISNINALIIQNIGVNFFIKNCDCKCDVCLYNM